MLAKLSSSGRRNAKLVHSTVTKIDRNQTSLAGGWPHPRKFLSPLPLRPHRVY